MKVAVYGVCKNEEKNVESWLENACLHGDTVTLLDTGSTDDTRAKARAWIKNNGADKVVGLHRGLIQPWRFDVGHNSALTLVPPEPAMCIPLALDERIMTGVGDYLRKYVQEEDRPIKVSYMYDFRPDYSFMHDRIHSRHHYVWRYPFHEGCYPWGPKKDEERRYIIPELRIIQQQNLGVDRMTRDLELMKVAMDEYPNDRRMVFVCGRQLFYAKQYHEAIELLTRYYSMPGPMHPWEAASVSETLHWCYKNLQG